MSLIKKLLIACGVVVFLLIAVVLFLPVFVDVNDYKDKIEQLAQDHLGRELTLNGELELKTFPTLRLKTGELSLANPPGFPHQNMLEVNNAEIGIKVLPLLTQKVEVGTIKIDSPVINLTKKSTGEVNWAFPGITDNDQTDDDQTTSTTALGAFAIKGFEISNARFNYADLATDTVILAESIHLKTGSILPEKTFPINIEADLRGSMFTDPVQASLSVQSRVDADLKKLDLSQLSSRVVLDAVSYEAMAPAMTFDIQDNQIAINNLNFIAPIDGQSKAELNVPEFNVDLNQLVGGLTELSVNYTAAELDAVINVPNLKFDANKQVVNFDRADMTATNPELKAQLELPGADIDLTQENLAIKNLTGNVALGSLDAQLSVPAAMFNTNSTQFSIPKAQLLIGEDRITTDVSGALDPVRASFTFGTENLNLNRLLRALDIEFTPESASALSNLDLELRGQLDENAMVVEEFSGKLDETKLSGRFSVNNFSNPDIDIKLDLGDLALDDYLPQSTPQSEGEQNGKSTADTPGAPIPLTGLNIDAELNTQRLYSETNGISLENIRFSMKPDGDETAISFIGAISGSAMPETVQADLRMSAQINAETSHARLGNIRLKTRGKTINAGISIPHANIPFNAGNINLADITANFANASANAELTLPKVDFNAKNSTLIINDISGNASVNGINASILLPNLSTDLTSQRLKVNELALDVSGEKPVGRLSIPTLEVNLENQTLGATRMIFEGQDGRAELALKPTDASGTYAGNLLAKDINLRGILHRFNLMTDLADDSALTKVNIRSPVTFSETKLKLANLDASVDATRISGFADISVGLKPTYNFDIKVGELNADRYIPAASEQNTPSSTKAVGAPVAIPVELLRNTTANGKVHFDKLKLGGAQFDNLTIGVSAKNARVSVSPIQSGFFSGSMNGDLAINSSAPKPKVEFNYTLSQVALEQALSSLGVTRKLAGNGNFDLKIDATGLTDKELTSTLKGKAALQVNNGAIKGVNLQDILFKGYQAYSALKNRDINEKYNPAEQTEFSSMSGSWHINKGIVSGKDLDIQAPLFRVTGAGKVSLVDNTIDYALNVKVVKSLEGQGGKSIKELEGRTIPLRISGPLTNPRYNLDISGLVSAEIKLKAEEKIEQKIEEKLGEKLEGEGSLKEKLQKKALEKASEKLFDLFN